MFTVAERKNLLPSLLEQAGLTIYGLAKKMQMPYHNVKRLVESPMIPDGTTYKTLRNLADTLGVTIDQLEDKE